MEQKEVQDALALSADQVGELKKAGIGDVSLEVANTQYMPAQKKGVDRDETGRAAMRPHEVYTSSIERVLSPEQKERFEQILLQIQGPKVIVENEVFARMLSIDDGQKKEMTQINERYNKDLAVLIKRVMALEVSEFPYLIVKSNSNVCIMSLNAWKEKETWSFSWL